MENLMYQLEADYLYTKDAEGVIFKSEDFKTARKRFAKTSEDEEILTAVTAESEHNGFLKGFKCAMLLKKECGMV